LPGSGAKRKRFLWGILERSMILVIGHGTTSLGEKQFIYDDLPIIFTTIELLIFGSMPMFSKAANHHTSWGQVVFCVFILVIIFRPKHPPLASSEEFEKNI
jgi:hypothetical protein